MGMYHYLTINLKLSPDAPEIVHAVLLGMCEEVLAEHSDDAKQFLEGLKKETGQGQWLRHAFFKHGRWQDIFGNWAGDTEDWAWNDLGPTSSYEDHLLKVRCSFKNDAEYVSLLSWLEPWILEDKYNSVFGWFEGRNYPGSPPTIYYGTKEAAQSLGPASERYKEKP